MSEGLERFLRRRTNIARGSDLGRVFAVVCETWRLDADPQAVAPRLEVLAARRTASDAADLAREAAAGFRRHGYHKPSRAWWGADDTHFHRFRVSRGAPPTAQVLLAGSALAALAALVVGAGLTGRARRRRSRSV